ncbi:MAG: hypothetical protein ACQEP2_06875 [Actinomycetota bacterium]
MPLSVPCFPMPQSWKSPTAYCSMVIPSRLSIITTVISAEVSASIFASKLSSYAEEVKSNTST